MSQHGLYIDDPAHLVLRPGYLESLLELGLDHIVLCVHDASGRWAWDSIQVRRAHEACARIGLDVSLMTWPPMVGGAFAGHVAHLGGLSPSRWEADLEGNRHGAAEQLRRSALALVDAARELGIPLDITSHAGHAELIEGGFDVHDLLGEESVVWGQAYCLAKRAATEPLFGLPRAVERTIARLTRLTRLTGPFQRGLILAGWDQTGFSGQPLESMVEAYRVARAYTSLIRWWSSKFAVGVQRNGYAAEGIRRCVALP